MNHAGFVSLDRAAESCSVSHGVLRHWLRREGLHLHRTATGFVVHWSDLRRCLERHGREDWS